MSKGNQSARFAAQAMISPITGEVKKEGTTTATRDRLMSACERILAPTCNARRRSASPASPLKHHRWASLRQRTTSPVERYRSRAKSIFQENSKFLNNDRIREIPLFKMCSPSFVEELIKDISVEAYNFGDTILQEGDLGDKLYLLNRGTVTVDVGGNTVARLSDGSYFGEMCLLQGKGAKRTATITAQTFCDCRVLHNACFQRLLNIFPNEKAFFEKEAQRRLAELDAMKVANEKKRRRSSSKESCANELPASQPNTPDSETKLTKPRRRISSKEASGYHTDSEPKAPEPPKRSASKESSGSMVVEPRTRSSSKESSGGQDSEPKSPVSEANKSIGSRRLIAAKEASSRRPDSEPNAPELFKRRSSSKESLGRPASEPKAPEQRRRGASKESLGLALPTPLRRLTSKELPEPQLPAAIRRRSSSKETPEHLPDLVLTSAR